MFVSKSDRLDIIAAVTEANRLIKSQSFYQGILNFPDQIFKSSNISPANLCSYIKSYFIRSTETIEVHTYWYFRSGVYGMYDPKYPNRIYINVRSLPRSKASIVGTLVHEMGHYVEKLVKKDLAYKYFNHGSNKYKPWKSKTAQYYIGNVAFDIIKNPTLPINPLGDKDTDSGTKITTRKAWYKKVLDFLVFWR